ncbi:MAG: hypothetical protein AB7S36_02555 [Planctomycetota bacterium]
MSKKHRTRMRDLTPPDEADAPTATTVAVAPPASAQLHGLLANLPPDDDLTGEYVLWLSDDCPVHSAVVAGVDIPRFIDLHTFACGGCHHRYLPPQGGPTHCPACLRRGKHVAGQVDGRSPARRARKHVHLTDARVRELQRRLDPARELTFDARGRRLDGPRTIHTPDGEMLLAPFVRLVRLDDAGGADDPESIMAALERRARMRRLARAAELLAADTPPPAAERTRLAGEVRALVEALGLQPRGHDDE